MGTNPIHITLKIGGMTCINCQNRIEKTLRRTAGVAEVSVRYDKGTAELTYDPDAVSLEEIRKIVERLGYSVSPERSGERTVFVLAVILCLYLLLQRFGVLNLLVPSQLADTRMGYGMLFLVGLLTSVHCIAMCGGINLSQCVPSGAPQAEAGGRFAAFRPALLYNLGRVLSYTAIGFLLGLVGLLLGGGFGAGIPVLLQGVLKLIAGAFMAVMGVNLLGLFPWLRRLTVRLPQGLSDKLCASKARSRRPLVVGLLNGLMPCGPLQSMQIVALASGNPVTGALSMLLFSLGTVPLMLGLGSLVSALGQRFSRAVMEVGGVLVVVLGLAMLSQGGSLSGLVQPMQLSAWIAALCVLGAAASIPFRSRAAHRAGIALGVCAAAMVVFCCGKMGADVDAEGTASMENGVQVVASTLSSGQYPDITVEAGTPVRWTIEAPEGSINGCNYKMLLQEYGVEHTFQEGENVIEFYPAEAGTFQYSCWMGMIRGTIVVTAAAGEGNTEG